MSEHDRQERGRAGNRSPGATHVDRTTRKPPGRDPDGVATEGALPENSVAPSPSPSLPDAIGAVKALVDGVLTTMPDSESELTEVGAELLDLCDAARAALPVIERAVVDAAQAHQNAQDSWEECDRLRGVISWASGANGHFPLRQVGEGLYWWRKELIIRARGAETPQVAALTEEWDVGYPKQPGQDAEAHRAVTEKAFSLTRENERLRRERDEARGDLAGLVDHSKMLESEGAKARARLRECEADNRLAKEVAEYELPDDEPVPCVTLEIDAELWRSFRAALAPEGEQKT